MNHQDESIEEEKTLEEVFQEWLASSETLRANLGELLFTMIEKED